LFVYQTFLNSRIYQIKIEICEFFFGDQLKIKSGRRYA